MTSSREVSDSDPKRHPANLVDKPTLSEVYYKVRRWVHIFKPPCNFLFIILDTSVLREIAQTTVQKREMMPTISSLVRIWKIRHSGPGCSFVWILRTVYFPVKHSCLHDIRTVKNTFNAGGTGGYFWSTFDTFS